MPLGVYLSRRCLVLACALALMTLAAVLMVSMTALFPLGFVLCGVEALLGIRVRAWLPRRAGRQSEATRLITFG